MPNWRRCSRSNRSTPSSEGETSVANAVKVPKRPDSLREGDTKLDVHQESPSAKDGPTHGHHIPTSAAYAGGKCWADFGEPPIHISPPLAQFHIKFQVDIPAASFLNSRADSRQGPRTFHHMGWPAPPVATTGRELSGNASAKYILCEYMSWRPDRRLVDHAST